MENNLYAVTTMCGHVGRNNYIEITFPVSAENGREAAKIARWIPRVKHHVKNAILSVKKISREEYDDLILKNHEDNYLSVNSRQDQNFYCENIEERISKSEMNFEEKYDRNEKVKYKLKKQKILEESFVKSNLYAFA